MRIPMNPAPARPVSQAQKRREAARGRAALSRQTARVKADVNEAIAEALAACADSEQKVVWVRWKAVLGHAHAALVERGYDPVWAAQLLGDRLGIAPKRDDSCGSGGSAGNLAA